MNQSLTKRFAFNAFLLVPLVLVLLLIEIGFRIEAYIADRRLKEGLAARGAWSVATGDPGGFLS